MRGYVCLITAPLVLSPSANVWMASKCIDLGGQSFAMLHVRPNANDRRVHLSSRPGVNRARQRWPTYPDLVGLQWCRHWEPSAGSPLRNRLVHLIGSPPLYAQMTSISLTLILTISKQWHLAPELRCPCSSPAQTDLSLRRVSSLASSPGQSSKPRGHCVTSQTHAIGQRPSPTDALVNSRHSAGLSARHRPAPASIDGDSHAPS